MSCREFERYLCDWVAGRAPESQVARMEAHVTICPNCARAETAERSLRAQWQKLSITSSARPSLWPRLAARLETPAMRQPPRMAFVRRPSFGLSLLFIGALGAFVWPRLLPGSPQSGGPIAETDGVDEARTVHLIATMEALPDPESDSASAEARQRRSDERLILTNGEK